MNVTIIGTGYVGLVAGLSFCRWGNNVMCLDLDEEKIQKLQRGVCPIYEPGATTQLKDGLESGRLSFTSDVKTAITYSNLIFIAVGTPEELNGAVDLSYVYAAADSIVQYMTSDKIVVNKSTVPIGTAQMMRSYFQERLHDMGKQDLHVEVASNPEFMREGKAVGDFDNPDRIILGVSSEHAKERLTTLYNAFVRSNKTICVTTPETAEMIKYASNAFLATKITFINEIAELCERVGADVTQVAAMMGKDGRISPKFLHPGPGYGGSCFPKDTKALVNIGEKNAAPQTIVAHVVQANEKQKIRAAEKVTARFPDGACLAVLGLSFKPGTDDIRESPAISIVSFLLEAGNFALRLFDPRAMANARNVLDTHSEKITWCKSAAEAMEGVDAILIPTEWSEFCSLDFETIGLQMGHKVLFDFRNIYQKERIEKLGFEYFGTGICS